MDSIAVRGGGYGLDRELAEKARLKFDPEQMAIARNWIEVVTGETFAEPDNFMISLKDGQLLCKLINNIKPGTIPKINMSKMAFKQMENISNLSVLFNILLNGMITVFIVLSLVFFLGKW